MLPERFFFFSDLRLSGRDYLHTWQAGLQNALLLLSGCTGSTCKESLRRRPRKVVCGIRELCPLSLNRRKQENGGHETRHFLSGWGSRVRAAELAQGALDVPVAVHT